MAATPAIAALDGAGIDHAVHEYRHERRSTDYGAEAVETLTTRLGISAGQIFKTLVLDLGERRLGVAVLPVPRQLSLKAAARAFGVPKARLAQAAAVTRTTGYVLGGVSPVGQKTVLPTVVDSSVLQWDRIFTSAGKRGLQIELSPADLIAATSASVADIVA
ncbi:putative aminoacyl-tRNA deacylase [Gordonia hirsuta DSM 44140 = NBRC 16056]|uniref:Cys-tRNA(Pro)/Cys-tRNA(Cys) deacylase n=1 Tax=Gordonia hirsuta DSM 44140 = NBRC 16056 TaxID=1121927 RepID=L7LAQ0_9ACTN|nr:aminoacyl-tRNA deacylase [Gordonia hirsuta]GAC58220.1 putative aminoacyl-tRNA deacylase [Gordonia hirsuta DSM 44140 = NBRC 16056]